MPRSQRDLSPSTVAGGRSVPALRVRWIGISQATEPIRISRNPAAATTASVRAAPAAVTAKPIVESRQIQSSAGCRRSTRRSVCENPIRKSGSCILRQAGTRSAAIDSTPPANSPPLTIITVAHN
jgi:hypothetical protein